MWKVKRRRKMEERKWRKDKEKRGRRKKKINEVFHNGIGSEYRRLRNT